MGRPEPANAAVHGALGADQLRIAFAVLVLVAQGGATADRRAGLAIDHAELVEQNLATGARLLQARRIDHFLERGEQELIREYRELTDEMSQFVVGGLAALE